MKKKQKTNYVAIGIFIFIGVVLFIVGVMFAGRYSYVMSGGYRLKLEYTYLDDLLVGAKVRIGGGMTVGHVQEIDFKNKNLEVIIVIDKGLKINRSASFHIFSTSLVGVKYIDIQNYDPNEKDYYKPEEVITGVSPLGMSRIMELIGGMAGGIVNNTNKGEGLNGVLGDLTGLISSLNRIVTSSEGEIRNSVKDLSKDLSRTGDMVTKLDHTLGQLDQMVTTLNTAASGIDKKKVSTIVENIDATTRQLKTLMTDLNRLSYDKNSALYLVRDKKFKQRLDNTVKNLEAFSKIIKNKPNAIIMGK